MCWPETEWMSEAFARDCQVADVNRQSKQSLWRPQFRQPPPWAHYSRESFGQFAWIANRIALLASCSIRANNPWILKIVRDGERTIKICVFFDGGEHGGREENRPQNAVFLGERQDTKILKLQILLSRTFVVIAQAPKYIFSVNDITRIDSRESKLIAVARCCATKPPSPELATFVPPRYAINWGVVWRIDDCLLPFCKLSEGREWGVGSVDF